MQTIEVKKPDIYCPPFLDPIVSAQRCELQWYAINPERFLTYTQALITDNRSWLEVHGSLDEFTNAINGPRLDYLVRKNTSTSSYPPTKKYHITTEGGGFMIDGVYSLTLFSRGIFGYNPLAFTSFVFGSYIRSFDNRPGLEVEIRDELPVIVQLQGKSQGEVSRFLKRPFAKNFRWEFLLLNVMELWSRSAGFGGIYLLPAEFNMYYNIRSTPEGKLRYDKTAERYGFKRDLKSPLFLLEFD